MTSTIKGAVLALTLFSLAPIGAAAAGTMNVPVISSSTYMQAADASITEIGYRKKQVRRYFKNSSRFRRAVRNSAHVRWCHNRYRSYQARSNTWVAYSGRVNQCVSPYY